MADTSRASVETVGIRGRYNEFQLGANNNVGNPDLLLGVDIGPPGSGRDFLPGFDPNNYLTVYGQFPAENVQYAPPLRAAIVKEIAIAQQSPLQ